MKSKFQHLIESQDNLKNQGYNYRENLMQHFISPYIFFNEKLQPMILKLESFNQEIIYNIKYIKKFFNFTIRKDNDNFN